MEMKLIDTWQNFRSHTLAHSDDMGGRTSFNSRSTIHNVRRECMSNSKTCILQRINILIFRKHGSCFSNMSMGPITYAINYSEIKTKAPPKNLWSRCNQILHYNQYEGHRQNIIMLLNIAKDESLEISILCTYNILKGFSLKCLLFHENW